MAEPMEERQKAFTHKFSHDAERAFTTDARAAKALALWAADKLGKAGDEAAAYAARLVRDDIDVAHHAKLFDAIASDFAMAGIALDHRQVERRYAILLAQTRAFMQQEEENDLEDALEKAD